MFSVIFTDLMCHLCPATNWLLYTLNWTCCVFYESSCLPLTPHPNTAEQATAMIYTCGPPCGLAHLLARVAVEGLVHTVTFSLVSDPDVVSSDGPVTGGLHLQQRCWALITALGPTSTRNHQARPTGGPFGPARCTHAVYLCLDHINTSKVWLLVTLAPRWMLGEYYGLSPVHLSSPRRPCQ